MFNRRRERPEARCQDELGYLPWRSLVPIASFDACMRPAAVSLQADGRDALDA